ncbi:hypothetical protein AVEN_224998-1, partial [Araneus ventricosus]
VGGHHWCNVGEPHHAGTTLRGTTTEGHVLSGKRSSYKRRVKRPLQSEAPYAKCMSASSTFEYSSYCLGNVPRTSAEWRARCSPHPHTRGECPPVQSLNTHPSA